MHQEAGGSLSFDESCMPGARQVADQGDRLMRLLLWLAQRACHDVLFWDHMHTLLVLPVAVFAITVHFSARSSAYDGRMHQSWIPDRWIWPLLRRRCCQGRG
jgi:hypothetical protein